MIVVVLRHVLSSSLADPAAIFLPFTATVWVAWRDVCTPNRASVEKARRAARRPRQLDDRGPAVAACRTRSNWTASFLSTARTTTNTQLRAGGRARGAATETEQATQPPSMSSRRRSLAHRIEGCMLQCHNHHQPQQQQQPVSRPRRL